MKRTIRFNEIRRGCLILFGLLLFQVTYGQRVTVTGQVVDESKKPAVGVNILEKGTTNGAITDEDGNYSLTVASDATLVFSFIGLQTQEIPVDGREVINLEMALDVAALEEIVIVGYGTKRKADLTGAITVLDVDEALQQTNANIIQSVQGRLPGVSITSDGRPGGNNTIIIRGMGSIENNSPLYIVDGVPTSDISELSPQDIATFQVLKDAASASIYGARASNGVILITTKTGEKDGINVNFDAYLTRQWRRNKLDMLNALEYGEVLWTSMQNDGLPTEDAIYGSGTSPTIPEYLDDARTLPSGDTDWQEESFKPSWNQNYTLGISGKSDRSSVYLGMNSAHESGLLVYTNYSRYTVRLNSTYKISNRIEIGEHLNISNINRNGGSGMPYSTIQQHAIIPLYDEVGNFGGPVKNLGDRLNPVGEMWRQKDNYNNRWGIFGDIYLDLEIVKNLHFKTTFGLDYSSSRSKSFSPTYTEGRFTNTIASLTESESSNMNSIVTSILNYRFSHNDHTLETMVGAEGILNKGEGFSASGRGFFIEDLDYRYLDAAGELLSIGGSGSSNSLLSQFGRIDYTYGNRYLVSATLRRDGSSRFGPENRWAIFPALSAAWRISNESFFPESIILNDLKFRISWGQNGNQEIGNYSYATFYTTNPSFSNVDIEGINSGTIAQGFMVDQIGNTDIKWETSEQTNVGIDLAMLNNKIQITADYFIKNSKDLLVNPELLAVQGEGSPPFINAGDIQNKGFEFFGNYLNNVGYWKYNIGFNISILRNEVISIGEDGQGEIIGGYNSSIRIKPGYPVGSFYGYFMDGVFKTQEEVDAHADQPGKGLGRMKFRDVDGDGDVDEDDRDFIGDPHPDFTFGLSMGFSWKDLDFNMFWDGAVGNDIWDHNTFNYKTYYFNSNHGRILLDAWSPSNPDSDIPAVSTINTNDELRASTYFIDKGSYLRLKTLNLGYTLPRTLLSRIGVERTRIYLQAQNIFDVTAFDGLDFEVRTTGPLGIGFHSEGAYQHTRSVSIGLNLNF